MKKYKKLSFAFVLLLLVIIVFAPYAMGLWVKFSYGELISFYNSQGNFQIQVTEYRRGWFSSEATLSVDGLVGAMQGLARVFKKDGELLPKKVHFEVRQHLVHGPVLFRTKPGSWIRFDLAFMHSNVYPSQEANGFIQLNQGDQPLIQSDDYLTFGGEYQRYVHSSGFSVYFPVTKTEMVMDGFQGSISTWPLQRWVRARLHFNKMELSYPGFFASFPSAVLEVDRRELDNSLWVGRLAASVSQIRLHRKKGEDWLLKDMYVRNRGEVVSGLLSSDKTFRLGKIERNGVSLGSVDLDVSYSGINAQVLAEILEAYEPLVSASEAIEPDRSMKGLLATLFTPQSKFTLDQLIVRTLKGEVVARGEITWPTLEKSLPKGLGEILEMAKADGELQISTVLAADVTHLVAQLLNAKEKDSQAIQNAEKNGALLLAKWLARGFVLQDQNQYKTQLSYQQGLLKANNQEVLSLN